MPRLKFLQACLCRHCMSSQTLFCPLLPFQPPKPPGLHIVLLQCQFWIKWHMLYPIKKGFKSQFLLARPCSQIGPKLLEPRIYPRPRYIPDCLLCIFRIRAKRQLRLPSRRLMPKCIHHIPLQIYWNSLNHIHTTNRHFTYLVQAGREIHFLKLVNSKPGQSRNPPPY